MDILASLFPLLSGVLGKLSGGALAKDLLTLLSQVFGGGTGDAQQKASSYLNARLEAQIGRTAGKELAHAVLKQLEDAENPAHMPGTADQRIAVSQALAAAAALAYTHAGEKLLALQEAQAGVERARGTSGLDAARATRKAAEEAFTQANLDIGRAAAGYALSVPAPKP